MRPVGSPLTEDEIAEAVAAFKEHGNISVAARATGIPRTSFHRRIVAAAERGLLGFKPVLPGMAITKISTSYGEGGIEAGKIRSATVSTSREPEDGEERQFEMPQGHILGKGTFHVTPDLKIKQAWLKTNEDQRFLLEAIKEVFKNQVAPVPLIPPPAFVNENLLTIYPIADQHNGLLAWGRETGEAYDLEIGKQRLLACASKVVSLSHPSKYAIILNLGDWQHTDDATNRTPAHKNQLDADSRYRKILVAGVQLMKNIVEMALQKHEQVIIVNIPGNHDPHASVALDVACIEAYADNPRVEVWGSPSEFFFHRFGQTLIGATHGYRCKPQEMAMAMAVRARKDWGETAYHYFYFGHIHHESVKEVGDVRVESFQTLAANDAHHENSGYTSGKSLQAITIHIEDGEVGRNRINVPSPLRFATQFIEAA